MKLTDFIDGAGRKIDGVESSYKKLAREIPVMKNKYFGDLVCPARSGNVSFDRWFRLKEAYSSILVTKLIDRFGIGKGEWILDPFLGSGTTLVGARKKGMNGIGFEVSPFMYNLSRAKMTNYDVKLLSRHVSLVLGSSAREGIPSRSEFKLSEKLFGKYLDDVLRIRETINRVENEDYRRFLLIGLGCILEDISTSKKDGNGLRYPKGKVPKNPYPVLGRKYKQMLFDVKDQQERGNDGTYEIHNLDSRSADVNRLKLPSPASCSIFSPPYCNCFDYTEVYKVELWILGMVHYYRDLDDFRESSLSSHLRKKYEDTPVGDLVSEKIVRRVVSRMKIDDSWGSSKKNQYRKTKHMVIEYFRDMRSVFQNVTGLITSGSPIACIVGNSAHYTVPVATDLILAKILIEMGYENVRIEVARKLGTSSQQTKALRGNPYLRESIVIGEKP